MSLSLFYLQLILSFVVGGLASAISLTAAERVGKKLGAIILTYPTTALIGLFFIALTNDIDFLLKAIPFSFIGLGIYLVFIFLFILLVKKFGKLSLLLGLLGWFVLAFLAITFPIKDFFIALIIFFIVYFVAVIYFRKAPSIADSGKALTSKNAFVFRAIFAGFMIALAVFLSKTLGPVWGGLFAMFPAGTSSSYWLLLSSQSREFAVAVAKKMIPFSINFLFYAIAVYVFYPLLGIYVGTAISLILTAGFAYVLYNIVKD